MSMITTRTLKAHVDLGGSYSVLGEARRPPWTTIRLLNGHLIPGLWLHSIRLTPEPEGNVFLRDIKAGRNSIFASGTGKFKAELLNRFPLTFKAFDVVPPGFEISLDFVGGPYQGICEIELIAPLDDEKFTNKCFLTMSGRIQVPGQVESLIISEDLRSLIESEQVELFLYKAYGEEFAHQIFEEKHVAVRLDSSGQAVLEEPIYMNVSESLKHAIGLGKKHFVDADSDMVAILDPSSTSKDKGPSR